MRYIIYALFMLIPYNVGLSSNGLSIGIGQSRDGIDIYRLSFRQEFEKRLHENRIFQINNYVEVSSNVWSQNQEIFSGLAISPVFKFGFNLIESRLIHPYAELGIGLNYNSRTIIQTRDLSTKLLFKDRIGAGVIVKSFDLNLRYMHYSNANIVMPNEGIDIIIFSISYLVFTPQILKSGTDN